MSHILFFIGAWFAIALVVGIIIGKAIAFGMDVREVYRNDSRRWE